MASLNVIHRKPRCFYERYERKAEIQHQTHFCPGCGHGVTQKLLALAIDQLGIQNRTVLINPVGCSVFLYCYFDVGNIQVAHGRAPAVATAVKRACPEAIVISYQGDGDMAAIGTAEIIHAANRGEPFTQIFVNNGIYGMTGGQMAPTTPLGRKSTTSPFGRSQWNEGFPIRMSEVLSALDGPVFVERIALGGPKQIMAAAKAIKRAVENQVQGKGFSFIEVLSPCPTIWKMNPVEAQSYVREEMVKSFPVANFRDRVKDAPVRPPVPAPPPIEELSRILGLDNGHAAAPGRARPALDVRIKVAGFGGQGVLMLGEVLAEAGLNAGYEVSWLPSYGPEMRSGTSNCHVRVASHPIDSPLVTRPNVLLAMNEPSLSKFLPEVVPGGIVLYNAPGFPEGCEREDVCMIAMHCTELADGLGDAKAANIVMLGALLQAAGLLEEEDITGALRHKVKSQRWYELDLAALARGREWVRLNSSRSAPVQLR